MFNTITTTLANIGQKIAQPIKFAGEKAAEGCGIAYHFIKAKVLCVKDFAIHAALTVFEGMKHAVNALSLAGHKIVFIGAAAVGSIALVAAVVTAVFFKVKGKPNNDQPDNTKSSGLAPEPKKSATPEASITIQAVKDPIHSINLATVQFLKIDAANKEVDKTQETSKSQSAEMTATNASLTVEIATPVQVKETPTAPIPKLKAETELKKLTPPLPPPLPKPYKNVLQVSDNEVSTESFTDLTVIEPVLKPANQLTDSLEEGDKGKTKKLYFGFSPTSPTSTSAKPAKKSAKIEELQSKIKIMAPFGKKPAASTSLPSADKTLLLFLR